MAAILQKCVLHALLLQVHYVASSEPSKTKLKVAVEQWIPYVSIEKSPDGTLKLGGPMMKLLDILAEKLNYEFVYSQSSDSLWGRELPNGTWNGMMGMVHREEVEFAVGPFFVNHERAQVSDFSAALFIDSQSLMMQRPRMYNDVFAFLKPFSNYVYISVFLTLILIAVVCKVVNSVEANLFSSNDQSLSFLNALFWATKTLTQEASHWHPKTNGTKIIIATWLLSTLIVMKSYGGILTAMLTIPKVQIPIDSLKDLASQTEVPWRLEAGTRMLTMFEKSTDPLESLIFNKMNGTFFSCFQSCSSISKGQFVGICDLTTIKKCMHHDFSLHNSCNVYAGRTPVLAGITSAMAFKVKSAHKYLIDSWILKIQEAGFFGLWLNSEMSNSTHCLGPPGRDGYSNQIVLKLENFSGCFYLLFLGNLAGCVALLFEIIFDTFKKSRSESIPIIDATETRKYN